MKYIFIGVISIALLMAILYGIERVRFPYTYEICFSGASRCTTIARFKDDNWCETFKNASSNQGASDIERYCKKSLL